LKNKEWEVKGYGIVFEGIEQTKVKHTHSEHTLRHPFECQLKYENQDYKIGTVCVEGG
jgi:hypothetical protein